MATPLESLHAKLRSEAPVAKLDVDAARDELRAMDAATQAAKRDLLLDIRYRARTGGVAEEAKAGLAELQRNLPARDTLEAVKHEGLTLGENAVDVGGGILGETFEGGKDVVSKAMSGDYKGALTHPLTATVLGVMGATWLSNKILGTKNSFLSNLFLFTGAKFMAQMVQKYST